MCYRLPVKRRLVPIAVGSLVLALATVSCMSSPATSGPNGGRLTPCPTSPNCVCSQDIGSAAYIEPIHTTGSAPETLAKVKAIVLALPRTRLVEERPDYLRFEFRSRIFRFVDDVEFLASGTDPAIQVRSASRTGYSDLGVNRKRIESIRSALGSR